MLLKLLKTKTNTIGKTALLLTVFTITSSVLAVVRDKIFATKFGAGEVLDTYLASFKIPDMVFLLTATLISAFVIIPLYERESKKGREVLQNFIDKLFFTFLLFIFVVGIIFFVLTPYLAHAFFSGFNPEQLENLIFYSRVMLLSPIFMGLSFVFMNLNQKHSYFFPSALTGVFYNISIIFGTLFLYPLFGFSGVISGVVLGAFLYLLLQIPPVLAEGFFIKKFQLFSFKDFFEILKISAPRSVALALSDVVVIFLIARATYFGDGSVTMLNFAMNIFMVPINIVAISYSVATFPKLAKAYAEDRIDDLKKTARDVISRILFFAIPISFYFIFFSETIVGFLLGSKKFALEEIKYTGTFVAILAMAITFQAIAIMIIRIFYSMGRTWVPLLVNLITGGILVGLVYLFEKIGLSRKVFLALGNEYSNSQFLGVANLLLAYVTAFAIGSFLTKYAFTKTVKAFALLKGTQIFGKIFTSLISAISAKIIFNLLAPPLENSFLIFTADLLISGISFVLVFVILAELLKDKNYLSFKKKLILLFKK